MQYDVLHIAQLVHTILMQLCMKKVDTMAVMMVMKRLPSFSADGLLNTFILLIDKLGFFVAVSAESSLLDCIHLAHAFFV